MWFKRFQARKMGENSKDYEIVKWDDENDCCITIAFLKWNEKNMYYTLESVAMRLTEYPQVISWLGVLADYLEKTYYFEEKF